MAVACCATHLSALLGQGTCLDNTVLRAWLVSRGQRAAHEHISSVNCSSACGPWAGLRATPEAAVSPVGEHSKGMILPRVAFPGRAACWDAAEAYVPTMDGTKTLPGRPGSAYRLAGDHRDASPSRPPVVAEYDAAIHREWVVAMGQRPTLNQIAHLVCELFLRLQIVRLTQAELGDVLRLSTVHVNQVV